MVKYSITSQTDLENLPPLNNSDTIELANDVALDANFTPFGRTFSSTFDGKDKKITGLSSRTVYTFGKSNVSPTHTFTSTNFGQTHTIFFRCNASGTGNFAVMGNLGAGYGFGWKAGVFWYYAGGGWGVSWSTAKPSSATNYAIVRTGTALTLYRNGTSLGNRTLTATGKDLILASFFSHDTGTWSCALSNVVITSDAKDGNEVARINNGGIGLIATTSNLSNILSVWNMQEGSGATLADPVGGLNATGGSSYTWTSTTLTNQGVFLSLSNATIRNLKIESPSLTTTLTSGARVGTIAATMTGGTIMNCAVTDVTITSPALAENAMAGMVGVFTGTIQDCYVTVASIPKSKQVTTGSVSWSGGFVGYAGTGSFIYRCYVYGTNSTTKPDCGFMGNTNYGSTTGGIINCWSSIPVDRHVAAWSVSSYSIVTNLHYRDISSVTVDNKGSTGTIVALDSSFYNITQAPMNTWDFSYNATGVWSRLNDGTAFPVFQTNFNANISGAVPDYTDSKTITIAQKNKVYRVDSPGGTITAQNFGKVHTFAWAGERFHDSWTSLIRRAAAGDTGIYLSSGYWKYGFGGGSGIYKNISPINSGSVGKHRWVVTRDNDTVKYYMDGTLLQTTTGFGTTDLDNMDILLNRVYGGATAYLDELVITNDCKDQAWVTADYNGGAYKRYVGTETGLIHLWHFDENPIYPTALTSTDVIGSLVITWNAATNWTETTDYPTFTETSVETTGTGAFAFTGISGTHGEPILIYINGETEKGQTVTTLTEGTTAVTGVVIEQETTSIGDAALNPNMTYTLVDLASYYPTNIGYRTATNIIYYLDNCDLLIPTGCTYSERVHPDTGETAGVIVDGTFTRAAANTFNDLTVTGTFTSTSVMNYNGDIINSGTFNDTVIQSQFNGAAITNTGTLLLRSVFNSSAIDFKGDMTLDGAYFTHAGATLTFGAGDTITWSSAPSLNGEVGNLTTLQSDSAGTRFIFDSGGFSMNYVNVIDGEADTADITCYHSTQSNTDYKEATPHFVFAREVSGFRIKLK